MTRGRLFAVFTLLTLVAGYMTVYGIGAEDRSVERSVRQGSAGNVFIRRRQMRTQRVQASAGQRCRPCIHRDRLAMHRRRRWPITVFWPPLANDEKRRTIWKPSPISELAEVVATIVYTLLGLGLFLFIMSYVLVDWLSPIDLHEEMAEKGNVAVADGHRLPDDRARHPDRQHHPIVSTVTSLTLD